MKTYPGKGRLRTTVDELVFRKLARESQAMSILRTMQERDDVPTYYRELIAKCVSEWDFCNAQMKRDCVSAPA